MPRSAFVYQDCYDADFVDSISYIHTDVQRCKDLIRQGSPEQQHAALETLIKHWRLSADELWAYCLIVTRSSKEQVRAIAVGYLGDVFAKSDRLDVCRFLAEIAQDAGKSVSERRSAYRALERVVSATPDGLLEMSEAERARVEMVAVEQMLIETTTNALPEMDETLLKRFISS